MLITFSGVDGGGKTTQAQFVHRYLRSRGICVRLMHLTEWTLVYRIGQQLAVRNTEKRAMLRPEVPRRLMSLFRLTIMFFDIARFWLLLFSVRHRNQALVCDRFFYDLGIQALYLGVMPFRFSNLYWYFVPHPDLAIWLQVPAATAFDREGEHEMHYYRIKNELYRNEAKHWPAKPIIVKDVVSTKETIRGYLDPLIAAAAT